LDRAKQHFRVLCCRPEGAEDGLGSTEKNVRKIQVNFALAEVQWNKLAYIREIKNMLFYKVAWLMLGNSHAVLYSEGCSGKNVGRGENVRAVRKVKKGKFREGTNVGGGNLCTD
jgi:hypothetical protein